MFQEVNQEHAFRVRPVIYIQQMIKLIEVHRLKFACILDKK